jgi:hypothetical protein
MSDNQASISYYSCSKQEERSGSSVKVVIFHNQYILVIRTITRGSWRNLDKEETACSCCLDESVISNIVVKALSTSSNEIVPILKFTVLDKNLTQIIMIDYSASWD